MPTLFDERDRKTLLARLERLEAGAPRQWGKMEPAQMMAHCTASFELAMCEPPGKQKLIGKLLARFFRAEAVGDKTFSRNSPTDPRLVMSDARDFARERELLLATIDRYVALGPAEAGKRVHVFFGTLTGAEWGVLMYKHLDHHLRQFGG